MRDLFRLAVYVLVLAIPTGMIWIFLGLRHAGPRVIEVADRKAGLERIISDLNLRDATVRQAIEHLHDATGVRITFSEKLLAAFPLNADSPCWDTRVDALLHQVNLRDGLEAVLGAATEHSRTLISYKSDGGDAIRIELGSEEPTVARSYDVRRFLEAAAPQGNPGLLHKVETDLAAALQDNCPGALCNCGRLVIIGGASKHREIERMLKRFDVDDLRQIRQRSNGLSTLLPPIDARNELIRDLFFHAAESARLNVVMTWAADDEYLSLDAPITARFKDTPLLGVLEAPEVGRMGYVFDYEPYGDVLYISELRTRISSSQSGVSDAELHSQLYYVGDLLAGESAFLNRLGDTSRSSMEALTQLIEWFAASDSWKDNGGRAELYPVGQCLLVNNAERYQRDVARLLDALRQRLSARPGIPRVIEFDECSPDALLTALEKPIPQIRFDCASFPQALSTLSDLTGVPIRCDLDESDFKVAAEGRITLDVKQISLAQTLPLAIHAADLSNMLDFVINHGTITIVRSDEAYRHYLTMIYDVSDLLRAHVKWVPAVHIQKISNQVFSGPGGDVPESMRYNETLDALLNLIMADVAPDSWRDNGGTASLLPFDGQLVISCTPTVHRQIFNFLQMLRESEGLPR